jgi:hypothetical protein
MRWRGGILTDASALKPILTQTKQRYDAEGPLVGVAP